MTQLSPAAQAVLDAMHRSYDHEPTRRAIAAEVLRALADQVLPEEPIPEMMRGPDLERLCQRQYTRIEILAIAAELEGGR